MSSPPPLIPRRVLFDNPERASPALSPDGSLLGYLAPDEGVLNVWVRSIEGTDDRVVTHDRTRDIRMFAWTYDGRRLIYPQDVGGDENWHLWVTDVQTGESRDLTPFESVQARLVSVNHRVPGELLVGLNRRDPQIHDVYRVNLATGDMVLEVENPGDVVGWVTDAAMQVRGAVAGMSDGGFQLRVRDTAAEAFRELITWPAEEEGEPYGFTEDGRGLYIASSLGSDTQELRLLDLTTGSEQTLASHPLADIGEVMQHPTEHRIQAAGFTVHRLEWTTLDPVTEADLRFLRESQSGDIHIESRDLSDRQWIVLYLRDNAPAAYYLYDRVAQTLRFLFTTRPALAEYELAEMTPVDIAARDGLVLRSYLTLPPAGGSGPHPLILNVHGGPWARDTWGYDPEAQWLANRGYACLQVNFRGSSGFGKRFLHAADREWGARMHNDLVDAVHWAVDQGIADPSRIAIYGGSYGGYAALVGAALTPDLFACSVDIVGPSSLRTLIASIPPYWEPLRRMFTRRIGDPETEPEFLDSRSPLYKADQIVCPLLIAQGANDPRVKQAESEQIVSAMRERGKPVEYVLFEDEGHGFARPENRLRFYGVTERFLSDHLGGRYEE